MAYPGFSILAEIQAIQQSTPTAPAKRRRSSTAINQSCSNKRQRTVVNARPLPKAPRALNTAPVPALLQTNLLTPQTTPVVLLPTRQPKPQQVPATKLSTQHIVNLCRYLLDHEPEHFSPPKLPPQDHRAKSALLSSLTDLQLISRSIFEQVAGIEPERDPSNMIWRCHGDCDCCEEVVPAVSLEPDLRSIGVPRLKANLCDLAAMKLDKKVGDLRRMLEKGGYDDGATTRQMGEAQRKRRLAWQGVWRWLDVDEERERRYGVMYERCVRPEEMRKDIKRVQRLYRSRRE